MTIVNAVWPAVGPAVNDDLAELSTDGSAGSDGSELGPIPAIDGEPAAGWTELVDGRGVFLRLVEPADGRLPAGPDAWYVHGLAGSSTNWTALAGALAPQARGFVVDLPGFGRSDPPPRNRYDLRADAELVAELIRRRSTGPVHLIGNSLGGMVSAVLASRHPELLASLTLISPAVPDLRITRDRGADPRLALLLLPGTAGAAVRRVGMLSPLQRARGMAELCFGDATGITEEQYAAAAADLAWRISLPWAHSAVVQSLRSLMRYYLAVNAAAFTRKMRRVTAPVLVIWGTRDRLVDPHLAGRTAAAFPDAELLMLSGVGHAAQMEVPEATARAVVALFRRAAGQLR